MSKSIPSTAAEGSSYSHSIPPTPSLRNADPETIWSVLKSGLDRVMANEMISNAEYSEMYTAVYCYTTTSRPSKARLKIAGSLDRTQTLSTDRSDLYYRLEEYLVEYVKGLRENAEGRIKSDGTLLQLYAEEWERYSTAATRVNRLFAYFNRNWINNSKQKGRKDDSPTYKLALDEWKKEFLDPIQGDELKLTRTIMKFVRNERAGEAVDLALIKKVIDSFIALGVDDADPDGESLVVYRAQFAAPYAEAASAYIQTTLCACLREKGLSEFIGEARSVFTAEVERAQLYVCAEDSQQLVADAGEKFAENEQLLAELHNQLSAGKGPGEDSTQNIALVATLPDALDPLRHKIINLLEKPKFENLENS